MELVRALFINVLPTQNICYDNIIQTSQKHPPRIMTLSSTLTIICGGEVREMNMTAIIIAAVAVVVVIAGVVIAKKRK